jgi:hypothetical protein
MEFERDLLIKQFLSLGIKECLKVNLQYFNCIEANSLISDYLYPEIRTLHNISDEKAKLISEYCDRIHGYTECNNLQKK